MDGGYRAERGGGTARRVVTLVRGVLVMILPGVDNQGDERLPGALSTCHAGSILLLPLLALRRLLLVVAVGCLLTGCVAASGRQTVADGVLMPRDPDTPAPSATDIAQQQGAANVQTDDVTGVSLVSALPLGLFPLLALQVYLSHRREMIRLRRGGVT